MMTTADEPKARHLKNLRYARTRARNELADAEVFLRNAPHGSAESREARRRVRHIQVRVRLLDAAE